jgi:tetratricopeptide (TPR) repeat protein
MFNANKYLYLSILIPVFLIVSPVPAQKSSFTADEKTDPANGSHPVARSTVTVSSEHAELRKKIKKFKRELISNPDDPILYNNLSVVYFRLGKYNKSLEAMEKALELAPNAEVYLNLSIIYDNLNRTPEAFAAVRRALEIAPDNLKANEQLCELYLEREKFEKASECFGKMIERNPDEPRFHAFYGICLTNDGKEDESIVHLQKANELFPANEDVRNALGMALFGEKRYREAEEIFTEILKIDPEQSSARFNLAVVQLTLKKKTEAIKNYFILKNSQPPLAAALYKVIYRDKLVFVEDFER